MPKPNTKKQKTHEGQNKSTAKPPVFAMGKAPKKSGKGKAKTAKATQKGGKRKATRKMRRRMTRRRR